MKPQNRSMQEPRVSTVISSYNYEKYIGETIESVLQQSHPVHEIIVVDDESRDNSVSVIRKFGGIVRLIEQSNQGVCVARNKGASMASGDILTFVDSDDLWLPKKVERQIEAFIGDAEVGLVSCAFRAFAPDGSTIYESVKGKSGWIANDILLMREETINSTASSIAVSREVFNRVGGFDERREIFAAEDRDFCYRAAKVSKHVFLPEILLDYRMHGGNGHLNIHGMERALLASYKKIFEIDKDVADLRRESYGNLFTMLAGSHFRTGNYTAFLKNALKALWYTPGNLSRFAGYPHRLLTRK